MGTQPRTFIDLIEKPLLKYSQKIALSDYKGINYTYQNVHEKISLIHSVFNSLNINEGDHIALIGKNSSHWAISYLSIVTYGCVAIPLLPEFHPDDLTDILIHSDSVLLFIDESFLKALNLSNIEKLKSIILLQNFKLINSGSPEKKDIFPRNSVIESHSFAFRKKDDVAVISYTSGTTGNSKGVMIPHRSLYRNILFAQNHMPLKSGDKIVSFLPLAHSYGCAFEFLFPFSLGCHITFLTKTPSPEIIVQAFGEIRPKLVLSVPLIIEKIYKKRILPVLEKRTVKFLTRVPLIKNIIFFIIRNNLRKVFGNKFHEIIIGGAALNPEVELFLRKIKFPFTIGYGMTECGPLISYDSWSETKLHSAGKLVDSLSIMIDSENPYKIPGEIMVNGENVMVGYYKNQKATNAVLDEEHWLRTGDLGIIDDQNYIFLKGRSKSMILGPSGQNIYPEEIESKLNSLPFIAESLVINKDNKIIALIYPDDDAIQAHGLTREEFDELLKNDIQVVNSRLPKFMTINRYVIWQEEFEKTPKRSIKRFLYQNIEF